MNVRFFFAAVLTFFALQQLGAQDNIPLDTLYKRASNAAFEGQQETAIKLYLQVLKRSEQEKRQDHHADVYYNLAVIHHLQNSNEKSKEYLLQALYFSKLTHDSLSLGKSCFLSGIFEFLAERPDSSIRFFEQSAAIYRAIGDAKREATAMSKIGNIYEGQGEYAKATPIFKRYLGIAEQARDTFLLMTAYTNMAGNSYNLHHYPEALQQVKLANAFAAHQKRDFEYEATLQLQSQIYEAMGAPGEALGTLRQYV
ncbi:MAG: tetratricopeptide repeat protein, partial [Saprospiraceae bacterium]|nr:tetratricopeptide repeat protein [Saprospiraceae bacterium]